MNEKKLNLNAQVCRRCYVSIIGVVYDFFRLFIPCIPSGIFTHPKHEVKNAQQLL